MGLGATSIAAGALHSTGAFSSLEAGRGVAVSAAGNSDAFLSINTDTDAVAEVTNKFDQDLNTVEIEIESISDANKDDFRVSDIDELVSGVPKDVIIECDGSEDLDGNDVTLSISAEGTSVSVNDVSFTVSVDIECQSPVSGIEGTLFTNPGRNSRLELEIEPADDSETVTINMVDLEFVNELEGSSWEEVTIGTDDETATFDGVTGGPLDLTGPADVEISGLDPSVDLNSTEFVDVKSNDATMILTFEIEDFGEERFGINASEWTPGN